jgi:hypothetical protein
MDDGAKIHLSALEKELVNNTEWIVTKQDIIEKVYHFFGWLHEEYQRIIAAERESLPEALRKPGGKISRGENYERLPFVILDYPATFGRENIFAVRTLFWWGNFFSISLHVSGENWGSRRNMEEGVGWLRQHHFFVCINEREWEHNFHPSNYKNINEIGTREMEELIQRDFFKIALKTELTRWDSAPGFLERAFREIIQFIRISFPGGEKVP